MRSGHLPADFDVRLDDFIQRLATGKGAIEEPILGLLLGDVEFSRFRVSLLVRLIVFLWRQGREAKAIELATIAVGRYPELANRFAELLFLGGLQAHMADRTLVQDHPMAGLVEAKRRLWDAIPMITRRNNGSLLSASFRRPRRSRKVSGNTSGCNACLGDIGVVSMHRRREEATGRSDRDSNVTGMEAVIAFDLGEYETGIAAFANLLPLSADKRRKQQLLAYLGPRRRAKRYAKRRRKGP